MTQASFMEGDHIPDPLCSLVKDLLRIAKAPFNVDPVPETLEEEYGVFSLPSSCEGSWKLLF